MSEIKRREFLKATAGVAAGAAFGAGAGLFGPAEQLEHQPAVEAAWIEPLAQRSDVTLLPVADQVAAPAGEEVEIAVAIGNHPLRCTVGDLVSHTVMPTSMSTICERTYPHAFILKMSCPSCAVASLRHTVGNRAGHGGRLV